MSIMLYFLCVGITGVGSWQIQTGMNCSPIVSDGVAFSTGQLSSAPFLIDTHKVYSPGRGYSPAVAFGGTHYFVVYVQELYLERPFIHGTRVTTDGVVLDTLGILYHPGVAPKIAVGNSNYLVVHAYYGGLHAFRISLSGELLDTHEIILQMDTGGVYNPVVAFNNNNYLVVWGNCDESSWWRRYRICAIRIDTAGNVLDRSPIVLADSRGYVSQWWVPGTEGEYTPSVASAGGDYFVVWQDWRNSDFPDSIRWDIYGVRVAGSGAVLDTGILIAVNIGRYGTPSVSTNGSEYFVVWSSNDDLYGTRVNLAGEIIDTTPIPIATFAGDQFWPTISYDSTNYLVGWYHSPGILGAKLYVARVTPAGTVLDPQGIKITDSGSGLSIASSCMNSLLVFNLECTTLIVTDTPGLIGIRIDSAGILDTAGISLSTVVRTQCGPQGVASPDNYLILWSDYNYVHPYSLAITRLNMIRVDTSGIRLDPIPITVYKRITSYEPYGYSATFGGTNYFIVWGGVVWGGDTSTDTMPSEIYGIRLGVNGIVDSIPIRISTTPQIDHLPLVTFGGNYYFTVWRTAMNEWYDNIYGARVTLSGTVIDSPSILVVPQWYRCVRTPLGVFFDSLHYAVFYYEGWIITWRIAMSIIDTAGVVIDSLIPITPIMSSRGGPIAGPVFDGTNYFMVLAGGEHNQPPPFPVYGIRVTRAGTVIDWPPVHIFDIHRSNYSGLWDMEFDGNDYVIVGLDSCAGEDNICVVRVDPASLTVIDSFTVVAQPGEQLSPSLIIGPGNKSLVVYSGWTHDPYRTMRIWGKFLDHAGTENDKVKPISYDLNIYPNPTSGVAVIKYSLPKEVEASLKIYDLAGRLVKTLVNTKSKPGTYTLKWDRRDSHCKIIASGIYFCILKVGNTTITRKMVLLK